MVNTVIVLVTLIIIISTNTYALDRLRRRLWRRVTRRYHYIASIVVTRRHGYQ